VVENFSAISVNDLDKFAELHRGKKVRNILGIAESILSVTWLEGDVKGPTHLLKRVGDVVPGVVVYLPCDG